MKRTKHLYRFLELALVEDHPAAAKRANLQALKQQTEEARARIAEAEQRREQLQVSFQAGDEIYLTGYPGLAGAVFLAKYDKDRLLDRYSYRFLTTAAELPFCEKMDLLSNRQMQYPIYPMGEGGLYRTLYQLGKECGCGFQISYGKIPQKQHMVEICEFYDINFLELFSYGAFLTVLPQTMPAAEKEFFGVRIGYLTADLRKEISYREHVSSLNHPLPDALLRQLQRIMY